VPREHIAGRRQPGGLLGPVPGPDPGPSRPRSRLLTGVPRGSRDTTCMDIAATDYHTAGEPFRIVTAGVPEIPGATVRDRREQAAKSEAIDAVRRLLCHEPRGHADMYGCFLVPPDDDGADLGVLFWHKDGYSTAC